MGTNRTGNGCLNEAEVMVLGGEIEAAVYSNGAAGEREVVTFQEPQEGDDLDQF